VRYDQNEEKILLILLENNDAGQGVEFSDHEYVQKIGYSPENIERYLRNHDLTASRRYHFDKMIEQGLVGARNASDSSIDYFLTNEGHERLVWHRKNTPFRILFHWLGDKFDKALTSVVLPIIVSILTIVVLNYFGFDQSR
jgi:hypothetical protein